MSPPLPRALHTLAASTALLALLAGVPTVLRVVAPVSLPTTIPTWDTITTALTRPLSTSTLLGILAVAAWTCWALFALTTATEIVARIRHVTLPALPLLSGMQRLTTSLLTAAGLLFTLTATHTAPTAAVAATATLDRTANPVPDGAATPVSAGAGTVTGRPERARTTNADLSPTASTTVTGNGFTPAETAPAPAPSPADSGPLITVRDGDSLWLLAERHLGNGARYPEILTLNLGAPQPGGTTLTDEHWIFPGWRLRLPADATNLPPRPSTTTAETSGPTVAAAPSHDVRPGDTLWDISAEHLGDGARFPEVFDLNAGVLQPDGRTLTDPDLIQPGWRLTLPIPALPALSTPVLPPTAAAPSQPALTAPPTSTPERPPAPAAVPDHTPPAPHRAEAPAQAPADQPAEEPEGDASLDTTTEAFPGPLLLGLSALAAAGVTGEVARRRHLRHRTRRIGERLPMPAPGSPAAEAERTLRRTTTPLSIAQLRTALADLAATAHRSDQDLPALGVLLLARDSVTAHLTGDAVPLPPWTGVGPRTWTATVADLADATPDTDPDAPEPYPALVTLGHTDDAVVLANLEGAGTLALNGPGDLSRETLRAVVAELVTSDLTGRISLAVDPQFAALAAVCDPARLHLVDRPPTADHPGRRQEVRQALIDEGADDTLQARSDRNADDTWLPIVYVHTEDAPEPPPTCEPWSGSALLTTSPTESGWTLELIDTGSARLHPYDLTLRPQRLSTDQLDTLVDTLAAAGPPVSTRTAGQASDSHPLDERNAALAALPAPQRPSPAPAERHDEPATTDGAADTRLRINILGPVQVTGYPDPHGPLGAKQVELLVYLALHGHATGPQLDDALWPGRRVDRKTRNAFVYRTRLHVGRDQFPLQRHEQYTLAPHVLTDWDEFRDLARRGLAAGPDGLDDLRTALNLVRGRPFLGIDPSTYTWADDTIQQISTAIADVAHCLSTALSDHDDHHGASRAASKGLLVEPFSDQLRQDALDAALARHDFDEARRLTQTYEAMLAEIDLT